MPLTLNGLSPGAKGTPKSSWPFEFVTDIRLLEVVLRLRGGKPVGGTRAHRHRPFAFAGGRRHPRFAVSRPAEPSDPAKREATIEGRPFAYTDEGEGPAILLVHGLPGSGRDFRWLAPPLSNTSRVVRLDMPGFGDTPAETEPGLDVPSRARFTIAAAEALGLERPVLVGHSMGGVVATRAAVMAPDAFAGLALIASPGLRVHRALRRGPFRTLGKVLGSALFRRALKKPMRQMFEASGFRHARDDELSRTLRILSETSMAEHVSALADVRRLGLPTLHAWSVDDPMIEADIMRDTAHSLGGTAHPFPDGGHNPQKHHAVEIAAAMDAWRAARGRAAE